MNTAKSQRIDIRLSPDNKQLIDKAFEYSGFESQTLFITHILTENSKEIISKKEQILATERDKQIFFSAIFEDEPKVIESLKNALYEYEEFKKKFNIHKD